MIPLPVLNSWASQLAGGTPVTIACSAAPVFAAGELGWVAVLDDGRIQATVHLPAGTCHALEHLNDPTPKGWIEVVDYYDGHPADLEDGSAVLVLEHEVQHIALQSTNECDVERTAIANVWQLVRRFKLPAWKAREVLAGAAIQDIDMPRVPYHAGCAS